MSDNGQLIIGGRRVDWKSGDDKYPFPCLQPGDYGKGKDGIWHCVPPDKDPFTHMGCLGDGKKTHKIIEHDDGTITVSPSILIKSHLGSWWHGYLERGTWRSI